MITISCPTCNQSLSFDEKNAGRRGKCPNCGARTLIPNLNEQPPAQSVAQHKQTATTNTIELADLFEQDDEQLEYSRLRETLLTIARQEVDTEPSADSSPLITLLANNALIFMLKPFNRHYRSDRPPKFTPEPHLQKLAKQFDHLIYREAPSNRMAKAQELIDELNAAHTLVSFQEQVSRQASYHRHQRDEFQFRVALWVGAATIGIAAGFARAGVIPPPFDVVTYGLFLVTLVVLHLLH